MQRTSLSSNSGFTSGEDLPKWVWILCSTLAQMVFFQSPMSKVLGYLVNPLIFFLEKFSKLSFECSRGVWNSYLTSFSGREPTCRKYKKISYSDIWRKFSVCLVIWHTLALSRDMEGSQYFNSGVWVVGGGLTSKLAFLLLIHMHTFHMICWKNPTTTLHPLSCK